MLGGLQLLRLGIRGDKKAKMGRILINLKIEVIGCRLIWILWSLAICNPAWPMRIFQRPDNGPVRKSILARTQLCLLTIIHLTTKLRNILPLTYSSKATSSLKASTNQKNQQSVSPMMQHFSLSTMIDLPMIYLILWNTIRLMQENNPKNRKEAYSMGLQGPRTVLLPRHN